MVEISTESNGLTLLVEEMPDFESVTVDIHFPGGLAMDADTTKGASLVLAELIDKGAGSLDSKALSDAYDLLGARHSIAAGSDRYILRASLLSADLPKVLDLMALQLRSASLPEGEMDPIVQLLLMDLNSLGDNPSRSCMVELTKRFFPDPYNRVSFIDPDAVANISRELLAKNYSRFCQPKGMIISVAGKCGSKEVRKLISERFADWTGNQISLPTYGSMPGFFKHHISKESSQTQICLAYPSAKYGDKYYYIAKVANELLSGGMFGRLFIEVREKRGLCYSVNSRHSSNKYSGSVFAYAGTTPDRARETLSVMIEVLTSLHGEIEAGELSRAKANLKASLIIAEESPGARSSSNAGDFWLSGRVRPLSEISQAIESVTVDDIRRYIEEYPPTKYSIVTLGSIDISGESR